MASPVEAARRRGPHCHDTPVTSRRQRRRGRDLGRRQAFGQTVWRPARKAATSAGVAGFGSMPSSNSTLQMPSASRCQTEWNPPSKYRAFASGVRSSISDRTAGPGDIAGTTDRHAAGIPGQCHRLAFDDAAPAWRNRVTAADRRRTARAERSIGVQRARRRRPRRDRRPTARSSTRAPTPRIRPDPALTPMPWEPDALCERAGRCEKGERQR